MCIYIYGFVNGKVGVFPTLTNLLIHVYGEADVESAISVQQNQHTNYYTYS